MLEQAHFAGQALQPGPGGSRGRHQRKAKDVSALAHEAENRLDRCGIRLPEVGFEELGKTAFEVARRRPVVVERGAHHLGDFSGRLVGGHADKPVGTDADSGEGQVVVAGEDLETAGQDVGELGKLGELSTGFLDGLDVSCRAGEAGDGLRLKVDAGAAGHVVDADWQRIDGAGEGEEMLELASVGAKVLQTRSVELAMKEHVRVQVLSSFTDAPGTMVVDEDEVVEQEIVAGIAYSRDEAKVTVRRVPDRPGIAAAIFVPLAEAHINVDMIVQNVSADGTTDMTFTVGKTDLPRATAVLEEARQDIGYAEISSDPNVAKISVVGVGMRSHAGVAGTMFRTLAARGINIQVISTSEIKVSVLVASEYTELAVRALHTAYELDA